MASERRADAQEPSFLDEPWLRRQVETHLVFGWFARRLDFGWLLVSVPLLAVVLALNERWREVQLIVVSGAGHVFNFRQPEEARRAWDASLDWLRKHVSPT